MCLRLVGAAIVPAIVIALAQPAHGQIASLEYRVAFNSALGAPIVVTDNSPGDANPAPGAVTTTFAFSNGVMEVAGTIIGQQIPGVNGRRIIVTGVDGHVLPGQFQMPPGTIDIYACYKFAGPGLQVPAPHVFSRAIEGSCVNFVRGTIDHALVRFNAVSNGACGLTPTDPGFYTRWVSGGVRSPVPFFDAVTFPAAGVPCVDITTVTRFALQSNGDGVILPASVEASAVSPNEPTLLYDNATIVTHPGGGFGGTDVSALDNTATYHAPHNVYGFGAGWAAGAGNSLADDFTVCGTWTITEVEIFGYATNTVPPIVTGVWCQIWDRDPRQPGANVIRGDLNTNLVNSPPMGTLHSYRTLISTLSANNRPVQTVRVPVNWSPLPPGEYWFEFQFSGATFCPPVTENTVNVTGDALQRQTNTWVVLNNAIAPNTAGVAIPFRFHGTSTGQTMADATAYGTGKAGSNGVGAWDLTTAYRVPILGRDHVLRIVNGRAGSPPFVALGTPLPAGLFLPGLGTLFVGPILATFGMPAFDASHVSSVRLPIPHGSNLCGLVFGAQGFWPDPVAAGGLCHSDGLELTLGN